MNEGKKKCEALKMIRKQIADANGIEYAPTECHYEGECKGTCPKCEAELEYLTKAINAKKKPRIVGVAPIKKTVMGVVAATAIGLSMAACDDNIEGETEGKVDNPDPVYVNLVDSLNNANSWSLSLYEIATMTDEVKEYLDSNKVAKLDSASYPHLELLLVIDEEGSVIEALPVRGNMEYADAAVKMAMGMPKWKPRMVEGKPVKSIGLISPAFE